MVVVVLLDLVAVPSALALTAQSGPTVAVHVRPGTGKPTSAFSVSLKLPAATGLSGGLQRSDSVAVSGPHHSGCVSSASMTLPSDPAGTTVDARLAPKHFGGHWCMGTFRGTVTETQTVQCGPVEARVCPQIVIAPETIGRFRFRVTRRG